VCEDPSRSVTRYTITSEGATGTTDRCDEHGEQFALVLGGKRPVKAAGARVAKTFRSESAPPARRGGSGRRVVSIEEIEQGKRQR